jgi:hypothetical protein
MRPPRVAVVFDGGANWHYWARVALHACTKVWGGRGFILVPHRQGMVNPQMLHAVRAYDPDYVVRLQRTLGTIEQVQPVSIRISGADSSALAGSARAGFIEANAARPVSDPADEAARREVVQACASHRRRAPSDVAAEGHEWIEQATSCSIDGRIGNLTTAADAAATDYDSPIADPPYPRAACLSAPSDWGGTLGVAVAATCGVVGLPRAGAEPDLSDQDRRSLVPWLISNGLPPDHGGIAIGAPIQQIVWHPDAALNHDPARLPNAFDSTTAGVTSISYGIDYPQRSLICIGATADDFALAYAHRQLYGQGLWLPPEWLSTQGVPDPDSLIFYHLRSAVFWPSVHDHEIIVMSSSLSESDLDEIINGLHDPISYSENERDEQAEDLSQRIRRDRTAWSTKQVQYFAVTRNFDRDFAVPINRNDAGDIEMVIPCPAPVITENSLAMVAARAAGPGRRGAGALHWQVDVQLHPSETPHGRGLDGLALLAPDEDPYLAWVRSGRDGITFESERFNLIMAGIPPEARLARPRLYTPGLATWANLMAVQHGCTMAFSAAGRQGEIIRQLWGDRAALAADFAGPMSAVLRRFRPDKRPESLRLEEDEGVALPTGSGDVLFEPYLTFDGIARAAGEALAAGEIRQRTDVFLRRGVLRRGLVLGCERCRKVAFYMIDDLRQVNRCPRCLASNDLDQQRWRKPPSEPAWYYDLHPSVRELVTQDGDVPLLLAHHLRTTSRIYADTSELELINPDRKAVAELDLLAYADGQLIIAEAKRPGDLGRNPADTIAKRALLAEQLQADQIVLATPADRWPASAIEALCKEIRERPWKRTIPRGRLISGLGSPTVTDLAVHPATRTASPWPPSH